MSGIDGLRIGSELLMEKHEKMVLKNKVKSQEKVEKAIAEMHKLLNDEEQVVVCTLVKRTGLSRAFFYNNEIVHNELLRIQQLQEGMSFVAPQKIIINKAMDQEIEFLKKKLVEKDKEIKNLKEENAKLQKTIKTKILEVVRNL